MERYKPKNITVESQKQFLSITWGDGHRSVYAFEGLRANCPCVFCRGGHDNMGQPLELALFLKKPQRERKIVKLVPSGHYGIQVHWEDGHNTGIFKWERLRDACPVENGLIDADQYD